MRRLIAAGLLVLSLAACTPEQIYRFVDGEVQTSTCEEDESCWDCPTMGNQECGPEAPAWMRDGNPFTGPEVAE